tara:strand:- start:876 stop:1412 length:537 start_codon:yes stop_codon:yes gene_type:complete
MIPNKTTSTPKSARTGKKNGKYSDNDKRQAVALYMSMGNMVRVSEQMNIPEKTLSQWKNESEVWEATATELRSQVTDEIKSRIDSTIAKCFSNLDDRLEHGDWKVVDKELVRVPVSARDAGILGGIYLDKRQVLNNMPTTITSNALDGRLSAFMDKFREIGEGMAAKTIEGESIVVNK